MYNPHSIAVDIEKMFNLFWPAADEIEKKPLEYISSFLDKMYKQSEEKAKLIDAFDEKYQQYKNTHLLNWKAEDAEQMVKDLRKIKDCN